MKNTIKVVISALTLSMVGNVYAAGLPVTTKMDVGLTALVQASCNTADAFVLNQDLSTQIFADGSVDNADTTTDLPITNGAIIVCNASPTVTTLNMVSLNGGIKSGALVVPYKIKGTFGDKVGKTGTDQIAITPFDSKIGPATDLLLAGGPGITPEGTPSLWVHLNTQAVGFVTAGNYADTLTLNVITTP